MKVPCKGCEERVLRCHSTCPKYEEFKKENARIQQMKKEDNEVRSLIIENIMKNKSKISHKRRKLNGNQVD